MPKPIKTGKFTKADLEETIREILVSEYGERGSVKVSRAIAKQVLQAIADALCRGQAVSFSKLFSLTMYARKVGGGQSGIKRKSTVAWSVSPAKVLRRRAIRYLFPDTLEEGD